MRLEPVGHTINNNDMAAAIDPRNAIQEVLQDGLRGSDSPLLCLG